MDASARHSAWYRLCLVTSVNPVRPPARNEAGDLLFKCQHCASPLIVNAAAAGMTLNCQRCGKPTLVPIMSTAVTPASPHEMTDLQRKLTENESQRTEVRSEERRAGKGW